MRTRSVWRLALPSQPATRRTSACVDLKLANPKPTEVAVIGALMLDAYRGAVDDEGEDLAAAVAQTQAYFDGKHGGPAMEAESVVAWRGEAPVGMCLVAKWTEHNCPFVAFVATRSDSKGTGVARLLLGVSVRRLSRSGHGQVRAVVTDGNAPSEALFTKLGFQRIPRP